MKRMDFAILLFPCILSFGIAIDAYFSAHRFQEFAANANWDKRHRKWEAFVEKLDSGDAQLKYDKATEDRLLEALRGEFRISSAEHAVYLSTGEEIGATSALVAAGALLQVAAALLVRKRLLTR